MPVYRNERGRQTEREGSERCLFTPRHPEKGRSERLEPCALKGARTVLRGGGAGNSASLPDLLLVPNLEVPETYV